ncbi:MAG: nitroreductase family protein [Syntrophomonas sp.]
MPIITRRAKGNADVIIDHEKCTLCGLCVEVCKGKPLYIENEKLMVDQSILFGCIGCGQCAALCPKKCIMVEGRELSDRDFFDLPPKAARANYDQFLAMLQARRSTRAFKEREVEPEVVQKIIDAVAAAPMGLPPSEVHITVLQGFARVEEFSRDMTEVFVSRKWMFSPFMMTLMRPFLGKEVYDLMKTFAAPLPDFFAEKWKVNEDWLLYGAPLAMYFQTSPTADPIDFAVAGTYAMLAAESLGLGTCMIGSIAPFLKNKTKVNEKYGIMTGNFQGIMIIFGYPKFKYTRGIHRSLGGVRIIK